MKTPFLPQTEQGNIWLRPSARFHHLSRPKSAARVETHLNREPSIHPSRGGLVVHSATQRSTAFVADPKDAARFAARFAKLKTLRGRNHAVDSLF
jgi:hypothetical protein